MTAPEVTPSAMCAALGDDTRWEILRRLGERPVSASALARELPLTRQAIAKHIELLRDVGLVTSEARGREVVYLAAGARLSRLARELDRVGRAWDRRLLDIKRSAELSATASTQLRGDWSVPAG